MQLLKASNYYGPNLDTDDIAAPPITHQLDFIFNAMPIALDAEDTTAITYPEVVRVTAYPAKTSYTIVIPYPH